MQIILAIKLEGWMHDCVVNMIAYVNILVVTYIINTN